MIYIQRFLDKLKNLQGQNAKDFTMSLHEANNLHADITKLLLELKTHTKSTENTETITVELDGGNF